MPNVFKIIDQAGFDAIAAEGTFKGAAIDFRDGFIHLSTAAQAKEFSNLPNFGTPINKLGSYLNMAKEDRKQIACFSNFACFALRLCAFAGDSFLIDIQRNFKLIHYQLPMSFDTKEGSGR